MLKALVVEDDGSIRSLIRELLQEEGFDRVVEATNGAEAVALAESQHIDLVVLDYLLKGESGIEVAEDLRAVPGFDAPVLVTTALPRPKADVVCDQADACECLTKPFDIGDFLTSVRQCMADSRSRVTV